MKRNLCEWSQKTDSAITVLTLGAFLTLVSSDLFAQWQPDVRLTNDPAASVTSLNNAWCVAASGNVVHVVWNDWRHGFEEPFYAAHFEVTAPPAGHAVSLTRARFISKKRTGSLSGTIRSPTSRHVPPLITAV